MRREIVEKLLRDELKKHHQRWGSGYSSLPEQQQVDLLGKLMARRAIAEASDSAAQHKTEPEEQRLTSTCGTLQKGTGGGRRLITKSSPFS